MYTGEKKKEKGSQNSLPIGDDEKDDYENQDEDDDHDNTDDTRCYGNDEDDMMMIKMMLMTYLLDGWHQKIGQSAQWLV